MTDLWDTVFAGYREWAAKPHNAKWVRKIDGTPIPNDLPVCIFNALKEAGFAPSPAPVPDAGKGGGEVAAAYTDDALAAVHIDFLDAKADGWMEETSVRNMFNAIASVFEKWASQDIMDRFREKLYTIGHQCFVEGAFRAWTEISDERKAATAEAPPTPDPDAARREEAIQDLLAFLERESPDSLGYRERLNSYIAAIRARQP